MSGEVRERLRARGFTFEKRYGQNFLTDGNLLAAIAADSGAGEFPCLEIGCGAGTLTRKLAEISPRVLGFEIDGRLRETLAETLEGCENVRVRFEDFMRADLAEIETEIGEDYVVCANLPYYITTPILMRLLEEGKRVRALTVMVQEEVAERLVAEAGAPEYGAITAAVHLIGSAKILRRVGRNLFVPPPNVDSAVVRIDVDPEKRARFADEILRKLVRCAFAMRRKTLANNLVAAFPIARADAEKAILACGFPAAVRGERLSAEDFVRLAREIETIL